MAIVLALVVLTASPALHHWLHDQGSTPGDDVCAVELFGNGVSMPLDRIEAGAPTLEPHTPSATTVAELWIVSPRYLRQPERGPPAV